MTVNFFPSVSVLTLVSLFGATFTAIVLFTKRNRSLERLPPIVKIPERELFEKPREAYERSLAHYGPVIAVKRKGRLEYIVDSIFAHEVLTTNTLFSFEQGTAFILNLHYFNKLFTGFFNDIDDLVRNVIITRMPTVVEQVFPVFESHAGALMHDANCASEKDRDVRCIRALDHVHRSISEAMARVILGPDFVTPDNLNVIEIVGHDAAVVTGLFQNTSRWGTAWPNAYRLLAWAKFLSKTIPLFYKSIGLQVWRKVSSRVNLPEDVGESPELFKGSVLDYLSSKYCNNVDGRVPFSAFLRISVLILGIIFASVHQTASVAVWVLYELATRPEHLPSLREELFEVTELQSSGDSFSISYDQLQRGVKLDSFIREVLRTKGDTLSTCRLTTTDVPLGKYTIPKGYPVVPLASLAHMSTLYHGDDAATFNGERWMGTGKQAAMVNHTYFPFGLGRWACPGRVLAIAEIKMIVWTIICRATPVLKGNTYFVVDPLNVTSVPPIGEMTLVPY